MKNKTNVNTDKKVKIFWPMLKISATTFGGGFVIVSLLKNKYVDEEKVIDENEMLDLMAIAQSCPGPIAVNGSVMVGYRLGGVRGAFLALLSAVIPPLVIISIISLFYRAFRDNVAIKIIMAGMLCGVCAVLIDVVVGMIKKLDKKPLPFIILIIAFVLAVFFKINVIAIIGMAIVVGLVQSIGRKIKK